METPLISRRTTLLGLAAGVGFLSAPSLVRAESRTSVRLAGTNLISSAPMFVAKHLGYFEEEGIDADVLESPSGNASVSSLLGRSVEAAVTGYVIPFQVAEKGMRLQTLAGLMMKNFYVFVVRPDLEVAYDDPAALASALKGKRFGVSNLGSAGDSIATGVLSDHGLAPDDVTKVAVGVGATAIAALRSGAVDALISYDPDVTQIVNSGAGKIALDLRSTRTEHSFSRLPSTAFQASAEWIEKNPAIAAGLVRAIVRANTTLRDDPGTSMKILAELYPTMTAPDVASMYESERPGFQSAVTREFFDAAQRMYLKMGVITRTFEYEDLTATRFAPLWG